MDLVSCVFLMLLRSTECQFKVFGLTQLGIASECIASVAVDRNQEREGRAEKPRATPIRGAGKALQICEFSKRCSFSPL